MMLRLLLQCAVYSALLLSYCSYGGEQKLPGHMKPLGSHRPPLNIDTIDTVPDPISFNTDYVKASKPLKFKRLLKDNVVIQNWQNDEYLRANFGSAEISIEGEKKETRSLESNRMTLSEFLDEYQTQDIYAVGEIPSKMTREWPIPSFLLCGGYTEHLALIYMWFSSGGTKSVLHSDTAENFHCVVSGTKTFVLIDKKYSNVIGPEHDSQGYYNLDVEAVDMEQYPGLVDVPWYKVDLEPGDCLYLPFLWIHHVDSVGRNMGVNVWWVPFNFNDDDCIANQHLLPNFTFAEEFEATPNLELKWYLSNCKREDGTIHSDDVLQNVPQDKSSVVTIESIEEMMNIVVPGSNGVMHINDLDAIPVARYNKAMEFITHLEQQKYEGDIPPEGGHHPLPPGGHHPPPPEGGHHPPPPGGHHPPPPGGHHPLPLGEHHPPPPGRHHPSPPKGHRPPPPPNGVEEEWEGGGDGHLRNWDEL